MDKDTEKHISQEIEKLAAMVAEGFANTATKDELQALRSDMNDRFDRTDASIGRWAQDVDQLRDRMRVLETRMDNLEATHN